MFCVKCGKEDVETINGLCLDCFLDGRKLISMPHHVDLMRCANCEEFSVDDQWVRKPLNRAVEDIALTTRGVIPEGRIASVGVMVEKQEEKTFVVHVQADVDVSGVIATDEDSVIVRLKNTVCKRCSRQLGSYYESIIQVRTGEKTLDDDLRDEVVRSVTASVETQSKTNRSLFISKVQEVPGGVDIYLSSISLGKTLTRELSETYGAEVKESSSLVGVSSDGQEVYRVTFLLRLPMYHVGDILQFKDRPYKLTAVNKNGGKMIDLYNFRETSIKKFELLTVRVLFKAKEVKDATVVSSAPGEIQVLHPTTYMTKDVRVPKDAEIGETAPVVEIDDELLYIP
ncbi:MAG: hypothetical protein J5673_00745 [Candidatus Methanomethylophilaceae archaeon]|nr:hypothetical protein [Candidatus Methanomethylophilaceae archaeon]